MSKWKVHARGLTRDKMKLHSEHDDEHAASKQARDLYDRGWHSVSVTSPEGKDSSKWASADMATKKAEKQWHIEILEKMPMKPAGQLANGKHFYAMAHHPAHKTFTAQEHAEAAKHLHDASIHEWQKGHDNDDGFGINHARGLAIAAKGHAEQAKAKGLPKHNNPKR